MSAPQTLVITGFAPFGRRTSNTSWEVAQALTKALTGAWRVRLVKLPVAFATLPTAISRALARADAALLLGEARGPKTHVERVAINLVDARIADNRGDRPRDVPVVAGGPDARFVTLAVRPLLAHLRQAGVDAELSLSAGAFACNAALYLALAAAPQRPVGFVHVPASAGARLVKSLAGGLAAGLTASLALAPHAPSPRSLRAKATPRRRSS